MVRRADFNFERRDPEQANFRFTDEGPIKAIFKIAPPTVNYDLLINKPKINHIELVGDKSLEDLGIILAITNLIDEHNTSEEAHEYIRNLIYQEATDRESADQLLQQNIDLEAQARVQADNVLQTNIDNEARDRQIEDSNLNGKIVNEALLRENADTQLQHNIDLEAQARTQADTAINGRIDDIDSLIPSEATSTNKLADKAYVLDLVKVNGASYRGSWATWAAVPTDPSLYPEDAQGDRTPNANDYMIVTADETQDGGTWMYKYTGTWATDGKNGWLVEYEIEKTPFTPEQQAAIDSGITSTLVGQITTNQEDISGINTIMSGYGDIVTHNAAEFATSAQGALADTALQPNDNISELNNDVGYTTNIGTVTSVNNIEPVDGNVTIEIPDSATWGNITGTLSNQTDLQAALDGKIDKYTTMPAVTASDLGKIAQFVGTTNYNYTSGYFYKVVEFPTNSVTFTPLGDTTTVVTVDPDDFAAFVRSKCTGDIDRGTDGTDITHGRIGIYSSDRYSFSASTPERGVFALSFPITELEEAGFTFIPPFGAQQGVDYTCTISTASGYGWQRVDVQPATDISGKVDKLATPATAGTYTKVTINSDGLVSSGTTLSDTDIPSLTLSKISDVTASAAEVNVLDGITASTAELNILDGATLSTTELNYVDGVTSSIQTQLDGKVAANTAITGATKCKITYDSKGLVTAGANLDAADIPALTLSKISDVTASAEEVNILDGATISTSELNVLDGITASTVELNILDGVTASTSEINILDGITATTTELNYTDGVTSNIQTQFNSITEKIPTQATSQNQLADKDFVNSSISTNTANFIGTFESVIALNSYSGTVTNNDYAFVTNGVITNNGNDWATFNDLNAYNKDLLTNFDYAWVENNTKFDLYRFDIVNQSWGLRVSNTDKADVTLNSAYNRYKATVSGNIVNWAYEYTLNNSSFTAEQWAAINSGITDTLVAQISTNEGDITTINSTLSGFGDIVTYNASYFATSSQGALADTALQPNDNISELTNDVGYTTNVGTVTSVNNETPDANGNVSLTIPTVNNATLTIQRNGTDVQTFTANASSDVTCNISVPTDTSDLTNGAGFINSSALSDYVPYSSATGTVDLNGQDLKNIDNLAVGSSSVDSNEKILSVGQNRIVTNNQNGLFISSTTSQTRKGMYGVPMALEIQFNSNNQAYSYPLGFHDMNSNGQGGQFLFTSFSSAISAASAGDVMVENDKGGLIFNTGNSKSGSKMRFTVGNWAATPQLTLTSNSVGIKNLNPNSNYALDVAGTINASTDIKINGTSVGLPSQSGNSGKFLTTDGSTASWAEVQAGGGNVQYTSGGGTEDVDLSNLYIDSQGASYSFYYDSMSGTIKNNNQQVDESFAYASIELSLENDSDVTISFRQSSEQGYDFGEISELDQYLNQDNQEDVDYVAWSGKEYGDIEDSITYSNVMAGYHFFTVKYIKDSSSESGDDTFEITGITLGSGSGSSGSLIDTDTQEEIPLSQINDMPTVLQDIRDSIPEPVDTSNLMTLNTVQKTSAAKAIFGTDVAFGSDASQKNLLAVISDNNSTGGTWIGRMSVGAKNKTFILGTYGNICVLGAHAWTNAQQGTGAAWEPVYINPDGDKAVYIGGSPINGKKALMVLQNVNANTTGTVKINRSTNLTDNFKDVACWSDDVRKFSFTSISGYNASANQMLTHDTSGNLKWVDI